MSDEQKDPREYIEAGRRLAMKASDWLENWWIATSPRNGDGALAEGSWEEWVELSKKVLAADAAYKGTTLEGATEEPEQGRRVQTSGEFAAAWNARSHQEREDLVVKLLHQQDTTIACYQQDHAGAVEQLGKALELRVAVKRYADDRRNHARSTLNTLSSWRVWSDLYQLLGLSTEEDS